MMDWIAAFFRSMNAKLVGEDRWIVQKYLKVYYGISGLFLRMTRSGQHARIVELQNFDGNLKIKIDNSRSMGATIYWTGFHELHEFLFLHKFLRSDMVFADIGANLGEYTLFAAKRVTSGRVLAFEPWPKMNSLLDENVKLNHFANVSIFRFGLSDKDGVLPIHEIDSKHEGLSTFYPGERKIKNQFDVPLKSFDQQFDHFGITRLDFIKVDIEGGELGALKGAKRSIERFRPSVMVEINGPTYQAAGYSVDDVYQFFEEINYQPYKLSKTGDLVASLHRPEFENIIFKPR